MERLVGGKMRRLSESKNGKVGRRLSGSKNGKVGRRENEEVERE